MFERFTDEARRLVVQAVEEARALHHPQVGAEHLLLQLLRDEASSGAAIVMLLGVHPATVRETLLARLEPGDSLSTDAHIPFSPGAKRALELSLREALQFGRTLVGTDHLLLAVLGEPESLAGEMLTRFGLELASARVLVWETTARDPGRTGRSEPWPTAGHLPPGVEEASAAPSEPEDAELLNSYLAGIADHPRLSVEAEAELAAKIERCHEASAQLETSPGPSDDHRATLERAVKDGQDAEKLLIQSNLQLVVDIARIYQGRALSLLDLIQEGNLGLAQAANKYERHHGFRFPTYATWWIRQAITRTLTTGADS